MTADEQPARPSRPRRRRIAPRGAPPGTLAVDPNAPRPVIRVIAYGPERCVEQAIEDLSDLPGFLRDWPVTWVNVDGLGDAGTIQRLGEIFGLHRLALEDVVNVHQRPKVDQYGSTQYIVVRMPEAGEPLETEQVSLFLGERFVVTFQERVGDCLDPVRERIRQGKGQVRALGSDYLAYSLVDAIVDGFYPVLEAYGERVEALEEEIVARPGAQIAGAIHQVKRDLLTLRRAVWPLREAVSALARDPIPLIRDDTRVYLRDCYDHAVQILDTVETYRELASGLMEVYLSSISNRMNEVMKVLTIIATIFIPLTFVAGVYGMNFKKMPELEWPWGYAFAWGLMVAIAGVMLVYFRRKRWL